jgi:hypothetical protein
MRAIGYLTICATVGGILALSAPFTERRSIKTWAPNVVVAAPKPVATVVAAPPSAAAAVALKQVPEPVAGGEHTAGARPATIGTDPQETGALPKQAEAATREGPRANSHVARKRPREARPSQKLSRP